MSYQKPGEGRDVLLRLIIAGDLMGTSLAVSWVLAAASVKAAMEKYPTLSEEIAARGVVTWLVLLVMALFGAAIWVVRKPVAGKAEFQRDVVLRAVISSAGWGIAASSLGMYYNVHPLLMIPILIVTGFVSDWITQALGKIAAAIAASPLRAWKFYRTGRLAELEQERAHDAEVDETLSRWRERRSGEEDN